MYLKRLFHRLKHGKPRRASLLLALPNEILLSILKHLDSRSLLTIKLYADHTATKACRSLYRATKSRTLWYHFIEKILANYETWKPDEPLENYTVEELEQWVLRRIRVREQWQLPKLPKFKLRPIHCSISPADGKLLPGGRWMVQTSYTGCYVVDLDAAIPVYHHLFNYDVPDWRHPHYATLTCHSVTLWIDRSKPRLTFRVASFFSIQATIPQIVPRGVTRIRIHEAELQGHGATTMFVSKKLRTIWNDEIFPSPGDLDGENYLELRDVQAGVDGPEITELLVYPYSNGDDGIDVEPIKISISHHTRGSIHIMSSDYLGIISSSLLFIFAYDQVKQAVPPHHLVPLHQISLNGLSPFRCSYTPDFIDRIATDAEDHLTLIRIPRDAACPPVVRRLGTHHQIHGNDVGLVAFGPSSIIIFHRDYSADVITYTWDKGNDINIINQKHVRRAFGKRPNLNLESCQVVDFDDATSRVVWRGTDWMTWDVI